ncbi:MAG: hypothetical protein JNL67_00630 [Planctomycetaceae bacterium]|nr:hypothetical protein [Planctomycetaceae bacterium]
MDRAEFVQAGELQIGERLQTLAGDIHWVQQKLPRPGPEAVYNLEVHDEHVYYVGSGGVLVHNTCGGRHHFWPWSWGNKVRHGKSILPQLNAAEHTHIHKAFSDFLEQRTGKRFMSMSAKAWVRTYGKHQLNKWLHDFHRIYSSSNEGQLLAQRLATGTGLDLYDIFKSQYKYSLRNGYLHLLE